MSIFLASSPAEQVLPTVWAVPRQYGTNNSRQLEGTAPLTVTEDGAGSQAQWNTATLGGNQLAGMRLNIASSGAANVTCRIDASSEYRNFALVNLLSARPDDGGPFSVPGGGFGQRFEYRLQCGGPLTNIAGGSPNPAHAFAGYWDMSTPWDPFVGVMPSVPGIGFHWESGQANWHAYAQAEGGAVLFDVALSAPIANDDERELRIGVEGGAPFVAFFVNGTLAYRATLPLALAAAGDLAFGPTWGAYRDQTSDTIRYMCLTRPYPAEVLVVKP